MAQPPADVVPPFWTEPWRWAAPAWRSRYGAPPCDVDRHAERLIYSGWAECFGLGRRWRAPADARWRVIVQASPAVLHDVASVLGHLASLRAGASVALACRPPIDRWQAFALKYRDVNCMRAQAAATPGESSSPYVHGVAVLRAMARLDWPDADSRLAMLIAPDVDTSHACDDSHPDSPPHTHETTFIVDRIDVGRCLSLCCAVLRQAVVEPAIRRGER